MPCVLLLLLCLSVVPARALRFSVGSSGNRRVLYIHDCFKGAAEDGMEHANGTFISASAKATRASMSAVDNVTAHEFFHLWNVMRIRPCSMEPVTYDHEQYTPTLWFSEGFTSAASRLFLMRAGYPRRSRAAPF